MIKDSYTTLVGISRTPVTLTAGAVYYAKVRAYASDSNHKLTVSLTDGERKIHTYSYFLPVQPTDLYLPFTAEGGESYLELSGEEGADIFVASVAVEESSYDYDHTISGSYLVESDEWQYNEVPAIDEQGLINGPVGADGMINGRDRALDCVVVGDHMYAICNGKLHTLRRTRDGFSWVGATERLGELRQLVVTSDSRGIICTARNFGLFSFDITDPEKPRVAAHIDSLEMATGLDIAGNLLFVADRTFGVDIIDIADIYNPVFVSNIPTGETQDVCYSEGYAYAGVWAECKVRVCDVRDLDNPREVASIPLSGRGDGVFVKDGYLYAATGQFALGEHKPRENPGYGLANGLEIWDVRDPLSPVRLSVIRADGASYPGNPDLWRTYTAGRYLFFTSVHSGAYVYDISDKAAPRRIASYHLIQDNVELGSWGERFIYPHRRGRTLETAGKPIPIVDTWVEGDRIYLCAGLYGSGNNLFEARLPNSVGKPDEPNEDTTDRVFEYGGSYYKVDHSSVFGDSVMSYVTDSQIRAVAIVGDYLYLAAGVRGVVVLDKHTMRELASVPSFDITKDVKIRDGYLYTAESSAGVAVYKIDLKHPERLTLVGQSAVANVVELMLSPDARFAVAHISNVQGLIDLRDKSKPSLYYMNREFHMVYQYQISLGCIGNRYITASATKGKIQIYDFGEGGNLPEPKISEILDETPISGMCALGDELFAASGKNIYILPLDDVNLTRPLLNPEISHRIEGMLALPVVHGDLLFSVSRKSGGYSILRLDPERRTATPLLAHSFRANPCITVTDGERFYLPLGYGGLISFKL